MLSGQIGSSIDNSIQSQNQNFSAPVTRLERSSDKHCILNATKSGKLVVQTFEFVITISRFFVTFCTSKKIVEKFWSILNSKLVRLFLIYDLKFGKNYKQDLLRRKQYFYVRRRQKLKRLTKSSKIYGVISLEVRHICLFTMHNYFVSIKRLAIYVYVSMLSALSFDISSNFIVNFYCMNEFLRP